MRQKQPATSRHGEHGQPGILPTIHGSTLPTLGWRRALSRLAAVFALSTMPVLAAEPLEWHFRVFLDDKPIGEHRFEVVDHAEITRVNIKAKFKVKFLFFTGYRYTHQNQEVWEQDCLMNLRSITYDNGEEFTVSGRQENGAFVIETQKDRISAPPCVMSFAYWNPTILKQDQLVNPQTGEYLPVSVRELGDQAVTVGDMQVIGRCYNLVAKTRPIELCYDAQGQWLALQSETEDGRRIRYQLTDWPREVHGWAENPRTGQVRDRES